MAEKPLPEPPAQLKAIQGFMRIASDMDRVDPVVAYWTRLYSTETAFSIDKDSTECKSFLGELILWLEKFKKTHKDNEAVTDATVGQAHFENFVIALFNKVDTMDREGTANPRTVKMFYMAALLFEAMAVFGPLDDEISKRAKYAKFKAAYIQKCLKTGNIPKPGPVEGTDLETGGASQEANVGNDGNTSQVNSDGSSGGLNISEMPSKDPAQKPDYFIMTPSTPQPKPPIPSTKPSPRLVPLTPSAADNNTTSQISGGSSSTTSNCKANTSGSTIMATRFHATNGAALSPEDILKGQKYCKFANSALQYDDIPTAVSNLEKALKLLTTGVCSD